MYLLCSPAAAGLVPGCYRQRLVEAESGLPGWTVEVQFANPQPLLLRHPPSPTLSLASATLCQSHCLAGWDKQVEKALKLNWQVPWQGKHRNVTQNSAWIKMSCYFSPGMECVQINSICCEMINIKSCDRIQRETHQIRGSCLPSSINSSSWFRPGMSPKGEVGLNIAWSTALSCAEAILPASVKKAEKNGKILTPRFQLGRESLLPWLLPYPTANQVKGRKQRWTLRFVCIEHICIWLT